MDLLKDIPDEAAQLIVTSPPYNLGKPYESRLDLSEYVSQQKKVITECVRTLHRSGSICWQVGNYVDKGEIVPLDIALYPVFESLGLQLRNRIVWHFGHGLHATKRFSGRYEVILWFTRSPDYYFDLDPIRVPQKYPNKKAFKGDKAGQLSCNPLGKNPSDVWDVPNVKSNHIEKTIHPCQFPVELIERLVLSMTRPGDLVIDPFMGVASTAIAALIHGRRAAGAEIMDDYYQEALDRLKQAHNGLLKIRPMERPVHNPNGTTSYVPPKLVQIADSPQSRLFERVKPYGVD
ncbi:MAG: site-specific DNA-methyltransferase [Fimbriimonadaceae bacterium]|nr:site-specific DNA-methyltransferase [Fimbriimonadaceae bacterium]